LEERLSLLVQTVVLQLRAGGGKATRIVCGYLLCDPLLSGPILDSLPNMLKVNVGTDRAGSEAMVGRALALDSHRALHAVSAGIPDDLSHRVASASGG
jgi:hypothetical protein